MLLSDLINPNHLQVDDVEEARRAYREDHFGSVVLDDFLRPSFASGLLSYFEKDGEFQVHHSLKRADGPGRFEANVNEQAVSKEVFDASPEQALLARELLMTGKPSASSGSVGFKAHRQLLELITSKALQKYLGAIASTVELNDTTFMARTMRFGDMCTAHSDAGDGRNLCMLLYIGDNWQPGFGGRFQNVVEGRAARSTDPIGNRVILHRPGIDQVHQVEPIQEQGREWLRHSYSIWFGKFPPPPQPPVLPVRVRAGEDIRFPGTTSVS